MKELKFRVWDKEEKCMHQVDSINFPLGKPSGKDIVVYNEKEDYHEWVYDYELMEYSGVKDINGKDIYDGDIVKYYREGLAIVSKINGCFTIDNNDYTDILIQRLGDIEVVGNIYENPELLENK